MPSTELESAQFTSFYWVTDSGRWRSLHFRTPVLVVDAQVVAARFTYDYVVALHERFEFMDWVVTPIGWPFLVSTVLLIQYAIVPLAANRDRTTTYAAEFVYRPASVVSLAYMVVFGNVGQDVLDPQEEVA